MRDIFKANCQSMGIGSLPYPDAKRALTAILKNIDIPFWPQLPKRSFKEGMVMQFSEGIPCLAIQDSSLLFIPEDKERSLEKFYERIILKDVDYFAISSDYALGLQEFLTLLQEGGIKSEFVKGQITGPFTFASSVKDKEGRDSLGDKVMMEALTQSLGMKALWQIRGFIKFNKKAIMFIDEPFLGCFGSAYTPVDKEDVTGRLTELINIIRSEDNVLVGIHCCGNTDWGMLLDLDIDIISFDAYGFLDKFLLYSDQIKKFLAAGKIIAWGIVPTIEFDFHKINSKVLAKKLEDEALNKLEGKGLNKKAILRQSLITPSCGLGSIDISKDKKAALAIFRLVKEISSYFQSSI